MCLWDYWCLDLSHSPFNCDPHLCIWESHQFRNVNLPFWILLNIYKLCLMNWPGLFLMPLKLVPLNVNLRLCIKFHWLDYDCHLFWCNGWKIKFQLLKFCIRQRFHFYCSLLESHFLLKMCNKQTVDFCCAF